MYVDTAVRFRDPFVSSKDRPSHAYTSSNPHWYQHQPPSRPDTKRALTPPPDMTGVHPPPRPHHYVHEQRHPYASNVTASSAYRPAYQPVNVSEPVPTGKKSPLRPSVVEAATEIPHPRRSSQHHNAIASNFQIPRAVNDSGGSLSELAAQITCLFWFESSDLLTEVEESTTLHKITKSLSPDAKPTTGFRKWVTTILSTTCVAQNVVILALLFIYRLKKLNATVRGKPGSEYRLLTVALMLGNKFLDDNTYTNKTWAEVSGINVAEVHIMEVEFLSNMKYCLFTSEQDWAQWQSLLGKFASFFDKATLPLPPAPILPPASSLHLPHALPSPPMSNHASPPFVGDAAPNPALYHTAANVSQKGPTPAPSPLGKYDLRPTQSSSRKRSLEESNNEPPPKRMASSYHSYTSPNRYPTLPAQQPNLAPVSRLTLPSLSIPTTQPPTYPPQSTPNHQLPPLSVPARAMAMVYPNTTSQAPGSSTTVSAPPTHPQGQSMPQYSSRHPSPYGGSSAPSPTNGLPQSATALHPAAQISPTYFLQQRNSPYRPVHHVSTLLYPPPMGATQARPQNIELNQMQYQPLGKPTQHNGRLPYVGQNLWLDGSQPQEMTPVHQWPNFPPQQSQPPLVHQ